jgi:hypothetical protein
MLQAVLLFERPFVVGAARTLGRGAVSMHTANSLLGCLSLCSLCRRTVNAKNFANCFAYNRASAIPFAASTLTQSTCRRRTIARCAGSNSNSIINTVSFARDIALSDYVYSDSMNGASSAATRPSHTE